MQKVIFVFLWLLVFSIPWQNIVIIPGLGTFTRLIGIVVFILAVVYILAYQKITEPPFIFWVMILYIIWSLISYIWSNNQGATLARLATNIQLLAMVWLIWELCKKDKDYRLILQAFVLGGFVSIVDMLIIFFGAGGPITRITATNFDHNWLATTLALGIPIAWYLVSRGGSTLMITINMLYVPLAVFAVLLTGSRGGFIVTVVALTIIPLTYFIVKKNVRYITSVFIGICIIVGVILAPRIAESLEHNIERFSGIKTEITDGSMTGRVYIWEAGIQVFKENAIIGVGAAGFRYAVEDFFGRPRVAHNTILSVLVETGIIGGILFLSMFIVLLIPLKNIGYLERMFIIVIIFTLHVGLIPINWEANKGLWYVLAICTIPSTLLLRHGKFVILSNR